MGIRHQQQDESNELYQEYSRVEEVKKYISENIDSDLSAAVVSKKFELSVSSLQHLFKNNSGLSYHQYLEKIRMEKAFELINKEGKRVQQTMYATGYKYKSTFNKAFKKKYKFPPSYFLK